MSCLNAHDLSWTTPLIQGLTIVSLIQIVTLPPALPSVLLWDLHKATSCSLLFTRSWKNKFIPGSAGCLIRLASVSIGLHELLLGDEPYQLAGFVHDVLTYWMPPRKRSLTAYDNSFPWQQMTWPCQRIPQRTQLFSRSLLSPSWYSYHNHSVTLEASMLMLSVFLKEKWEFSNLTQYIRSFSIYPLSKVVFSSAACISLIVTLNKCIYT